MLEVSSNGRTLSSPRGGRLTLSVGVLHELRGYLLDGDRLGESLRQARVGRLGKASLLRRVEEGAMEAGGAFGEFRGRQAQRFDTLELHLLTCCRTGPFMTDCGRAFAFVMLLPVMWSFGGWHG
jgi:hypothetical protein